jgi:hypothetical protein
MFYLLFPDIAFCSRRICDVATTFLDVCKHVLTCYGLSFLMLHWYVQNVCNESHFFQCYM